MSLKQDVLTFAGGLDLVTTPLGIRAGACIAAQNYESEIRGYRRVGGYERFDGQPKPSEATYHVIDFDAGQTAISEGDTVTGATSGASGIALYDATVSTGTWAGNDAAGELILYNVSGTFQDNENLQVSAATVAVADGTATENGAATDTLNNTYTRAAREKRRDAIAAMTGSGAVRGVFTYKGDVYAFRDNAGGTAGQLYKATSAGWVLQTFGHTVDFTSGTGEFTEGETLTGGTSGATATIERVVLQSGSWGTTAAGYLVLSGITGTFQAETITDGASGSATCGGAQSAITLPDGGKYRTIVHNFYGASNLSRAYFVNGEGYAHEWDGTVLAPIKTGVTASLDKPTHVGVVGAHLLLGYAGGSVQFSGTGLPLSWLAVDGAGEMGLGEDITGIKSATKTTAIITGRNKVAYISGTSSADFQVVPVSEDSGGIADTLEVVGSPLFLDDRGVRSMEAADTFGNWRIGTITQLVEPLIRNKRETSVAPVGTLRVRARDIYRLFYSDGTAVSIYFGREKPECMPLKVDFTPACFFSGEDSSGDEILLAGDSAGMVYEMDAGTSFDGAEVEAFLRTSFMNQGAPFSEKRYHSGIVEVDSSGDSTTLSFSADFGYGNPNKPTGSETEAVMYGGGGFWNTSNWNDFYWSSSIQGQASIELHGTGQNISVVFMSDATHEEPHTLAAMTLNFTMRRQLRAAA